MQRIPRWYVRMIPPMHAQAGDVIERYTPTRSLGEVTSPPAAATLPGGVTIDVTDEHGAANVWNFRDTEPVGLHYREGAMGDPEIRPLPHRPHSPWADDDSARHRAVLEPEQGAWLVVVEQWWWDDSQSRGTFILDEAADTGEADNVLARWGFKRPGSWIEVDGVTDATVAPG